jgi:hypothetical protein
MSDNMHFYRAYLSFRDAAEYALTKYLEAERGDTNRYYEDRATERALEGVRRMANINVEPAKLEAAE